MSTQQQHELRQQIYTNIDKLSDRSTYTQSSTTLTNLAKSLPFQNLQTFLSCILTVDSSTKSPVRVHCINLISTLARTHPVPGLAPSIPKILASLRGRLRENDSNVRGAVAGAVGCVARHGFDVVVESLLQCLGNEQDCGAQLGACFCLMAALDAVHGQELTDGGDDLRRRVLPKVIKLLRADKFKAKAGLLGVVASVVGVNDGVVINGGGGGGGGGSNLVGSVVGCAVEMLSSEDWGARKAAAEVLQVVADVVSLEYVCQVKGFVVSSLESRRFDKVKVTRETMNRAWEAWKEIPGDPDEVLPLPKSNSSVLKDYGSAGASPPLPRRSSFGGSEAFKSKRAMTKSRSSISGNEMPRGKQTSSKSRLSLSDDDSTITDSSSVSKSSYDFGFDTPQSKNEILKSKSSKNYEKKSRKSLDWRIKMAVPPPSSTMFESEDEIYLDHKTEEVTASRSDNEFQKAGFRNRAQVSPLVEEVTTSSSDNGFQKAGFRNRAHVSPIVEEDEAHRPDVRGRLSEEVDENSKESEELSLIRNQLHQIERQQSDLLDLVQSFMGKSQNGIDSLKTRVHGLERALDVISRDLGVQTGRITNNGSPGSTCCPSTEFLSPKFWRRTDGKTSNSKPPYSGYAHNQDANPEASQMDGYRLSEQNDSKCRESWGNVENNTSKSVKAMNQTTQKGRTCSPRSFDAASTTAFINPVVRGS